MSLKETDGRGKDFPFRSILKREQFVTLDPLFKHLIGSFIVRYHTFQVNSPVAMLVIGGNWYKFVAIETPLQVGTPITKASILETNIQFNNRNTFTGILLQLLNMLEQNPSVPNLKSKGLIFLDVSTGSRHLTEDDGIDFGTIALGRLMVHKTTQVKLFQINHSYIPIIKSLRDQFKP